MCLTARHAINPKTVAKWRKRASPEDAPMGSMNPRSTTLSIEHEAIIVAFRKHTLLALDDCIYSLQKTIAHLTRSTLHRCFQRHAASATRLYFARARMLRLYQRILTLL